MRSIFKVSLLAATVAFAVGCQDDKAAETEPKAETAQSAEQAPAFKSEEEKAAYAVGASFATYLKTSLDKPKELGINLEKEAVMRGISDTFDGANQLTEEDMRAALEGLDKKVAEALETQAAEKSAESKKTGDDFRAEFEKEEGVMKTDTGLLYQVMTEGKGSKPAATSTVQVHYKGTLIDGTQFDSSYDRGEPAT
ncbi:FKBP-type peptidyl-prolyl cis-trans isomerase, partial [Vibrio sp.]|nr:FKBP-type peptidyl-prolyl cis-trans isomerase [Vibrio sp.]